MFFSLFYQDYPWQGLDSRSGPLISWTWTYNLGSGPPISGPRPGHLGSGPDQTLGSLMPSSSPRDPDFFDQSATVQAHAANKSIVAYNCTSAKVKFPLLYLVLLYYIWCYFTIFSATWCYLMTFGTIWTHFFFHNILFLNSMQVCSSVPKWAKTVKRNGKRKNKIKF